MNDDDPLQMENADAVFLAKTNDDAVKATHDLEKLKPNGPFLENQRQNVKTLISDVHYFFLQREIPR